MPRKLTPFKHQTLRRLRLVDCSGTNHTTWDGQGEKIHATMEMKMMIEMAATMAATMIMLMLLLLMMLRKMLLLMLTMVMMLLMMLLLMKMVTTTAILMMTMASANDPKILRPEILEL